MHGATIKISRRVKFLRALTMKLSMFPFRVVGGIVVVATLSHVMEDLLNYYMYAQSGRPL